MFDHIESFYEPTSLSEALLLHKLGNHGRTVAGATDGVTQADRSARFLIDITLLGLDYIWEDAGELLIGAATTMVAIEHSTAIRSFAGGIIAKAAATCGSIHPIGIRFRKLPIRPENVVRALREKVSGTRYQKETEPESLTPVTLSNSKGHIPVHV